MRPNSPDCDTGLDFGTAVRAGAEADTDFRRLKSYVWEFELAGGREGAHAGTGRPRHELVLELSASCALGERRGGPTAASNNRPCVIFASPLTLMPPIVAFRDTAPTLTSYKLRQRSTRSFASSECSHATKKRRNWLPGQLGAARVCRAGETMGVGARSSGTRTA